MAEFEEWEKKFCPDVNGPCIKGECRKYQPTTIVDQQLRVPKNVFMCADMIMLGQLQTLNNLLVGLLQELARKELGKGVKLPPGFLPQG